jgi:hypothetical protein
VTTALPLSSNAAELTVGAIVTAVVFDVCHVSVTDCPATMPSALAVNVTVGAAGFTVMVTDWVAVPPGPVAVNS